MVRMGMMSFQIIKVLPSRSRARTPQALMRMKAPSSKMLTIMPVSVSSEVFASTMPGR